MGKELEFIVLIGPPGVGKTTWRLKNTTDEYAVLSTDDIMLSMCDTPKDYNKCWGEVNWKDVRRKFNEYFDKAIREKLSIVVDTTNMGSKRRRKLLARVPGIYNKRAILFEWDYKILLERNKNRDTSKENKLLNVKTIDDMIENFQPVNKSEEGFNKVERVKFKK